MEWKEILFYISIISSVIFGFIGGSKFISIQRDYPNTKIKELRMNALDDECLNERLKKALFYIRLSQIVVFLLFGTIFFIMFIVPIIKDFIR
jgi:hypothetical protein